MFGIGTTEMIFIFVVALVVLGPQKLPEIARTISKAIMMVRRAMDSVVEEDEELTAPEDVGCEGEKEEKCSE